ncbi:hypothetical protein SISSUDRAFT_992164 [Sistotremastrum suecicum HHB10207 ss-3]|uniref:Uncharacterized protein n=1 Tax=Sistotremastrum suecicum HHB10207 ss-3 TaxID=1314776 RepID=A0A165ZCZ0_9AGAM|nr:hypothetical protein SISSUDRAFT_992164 [Sistotremastrum suecicum HHB10207 ss-3]
MDATFLTAQEELELSSHIHGLLDDYVLTHLTIDFIEYTNSEVSDILSQNLAFVPVDAPGQIAPHANPYDALSRLWKLSSLKPYDQKWSMTDKTIQWIRDINAMNSRRGDTKAGKVWWEEDQSK